MESNMLLSKMSVIDLKSPVRFSHSNSKKGMAYEYRQNHFCSRDGASRTSGVSEMRPPLPRQLQSKNLFMPRSISGDGLRSVELPGKSSRYRSLSSGHAHETLSHGNPRRSFSQQSGSCQRNTRLAHLGRLCSSLDSHSPASLRQRSLWGRTRS